MMKTKPFTFHSHNEIELVENTHTYKQTYITVSMPNINKTELGRYASSLSAIMTALLAFPSTGTTNNNGDKRIRDRIIYIQLQVQNYNETTGTWEALN
jgi:hypothetical protein